MPYAFLPSLLQCCWMLLSLSSACLVVLCLMQLSLSKGLGFWSLFYPVHSHGTLWDSLSRHMPSGLAFLAFQAPDWAVAFWDGLAHL